MSVVLKRKKIQFTPKAGNIQYERYFQWITNVYCSVTLLTFSYPLIYFGGNKSKTELSS